MLKFTGLEYIKIDIANAYGLDKAVWLDRLIWVEAHIDELEEFVHTASEPMLMAKAISALRTIQDGQPTGHNVFLDATASGLQIMACLSGCKETARQVNLINTGNREDVYNEVMGQMNAILGEGAINREITKSPTMKRYYNSYLVPVSTFGKVVADDNDPDFLITDQDTGICYGNTPELEAFYQMLRVLFPGAEAIMPTINQYWNPNALEHSWTLPDHHVAKVKVTEMRDAKIEVDELDHVTFTYRFESNQPSTKSTSLIPNIIHSIDAYVVREMIRRANAVGFELAHIHDAFTAHANNMQQVRQFYVDILAEIADSNLLSDILSEISGTTVELFKMSTDLSTDIRNSEYALS